MKYLRFLKPAKINRLTRYEYNDKWIAFSSIIFLVDLNFEVNLATKQIIFLGAFKRQVTPVIPYTVENI